MRSFLGARGGAGAVVLRFVALVYYWELSASLLYISRVRRTLEVCAHLDVDALHALAWYASQELIGYPRLDLMCGGPSTNQQGLISALVCCISPQTVFFTFTAGGPLECLWPPRRMFFIWTDLCRFTAFSYGDRRFSGPQIYEIAIQKTQKGQSVGGWFLKVL